MINKLPLFAILYFWGTIALFAQNKYTDDDLRQPEKTVHKLLNWKAEDYFTDLRVISLCRAIEKNDLKEMERLIKSGADVNAKGKGNMTPLLWAYPNNKLDRFELLLKHGADPNVPVLEDFGGRGFFRPGIALTHLVCKSKYPGYFEAVFTHGGNAKLVFEDNRLTRGETGLEIRKSFHVPLDYVLDEGVADETLRLKYVKRLVELGADVNRREDYGTPLYHAVVWQHYATASYLIEAGANPKLYCASKHKKVIHRLAEEEPKNDWPKTQVEEFEKLVAKLEKMGESLDAAKADIKRWRKWNANGAEYLTKLNAELKERQARKEIE